MKKIDHIGIAVKNLTEAENTYRSLLNTNPFKQEIVDSEKVAVSFFDIQDTKIELLQALTPESPIAKFIQKKGEGIHHIAFEVDDLTLETERLIQEGFTPIGEPKKGADNQWVLFFHPKNTHGVLIEICQNIK